MKKLVSIAAILAVLAAQSVPAFAQEEEAAVTGVVFEEENFTEQTYYGVREESTGEVYPLTGDPGSDFSPYLQQQATVYGTIEEADNRFGRILKVSRIEDEAADGPASEQYSVEERTIDFELDAEGEPPADAAFSGSGPLVGLPVPLGDEDGDGTYTATATV